GEHPMQTWTRLGFQGATLAILEPPGGEVIEAKPFEFTYTVPPRLRQTECVDTERGRFLTAYRHTNLDARVLVVAKSVNNASPPARTAEELLDQQIAAARYQELGLVLRGSDEGKREDGRQHRAVTFAWPDADGVNYFNEYTRVGPRQLYRFRCY